MNKIGCIANTIITSSGIYFDYENPKIEQINIKDISKALSNTCRFGGHSSFYSVAEHSVHCATLAKEAGLNEDVISAALMHDAQEAYIGDMPKPLKLMMPEFQELERKIEYLVNHRFKIKSGHEKTIKSFDLQMLKAEKLALFPDDDFNWHGFNQIKDVHVDIKCWHPKEAEMHFFMTYSDLVIDF